MRDLRSLQSKAVHGIIVAPPRDVLAAPAEAWAYLSAKITACLSSFSTWIVAPAPAFLLSLSCRVIISRLILMT